MQRGLPNAYGEGIKKVEWKAFAECPNLSFLKFNEDIKYESVHRAINGNSSSEDYFLSRCGIIIYSDENFSYIWCFTDFRFYYAKRQDDSLYLKIVYFTTKPQSVKGAFLRMLTKGHSVNVQKI